MVVISLAAPALAGETHPPDRGYQMMAYYPPLGLDFMVSGLTERNLVWNDTWAYDASNNSWSDRSGAYRPPGGVALAYDAQSDRMLMWVDIEISGCCPLRFGEVDDMYALDPSSSTWTAMPDAAEMPSLFAPPMAYDTQSDRVVMFGATNTPGASQTWLYDYDANAWTRMNGTGAPTGRDYASMAYIASSDRVLLFGGTLSDNATWAYNDENDTWQDLGNDGAPPGRTYQSMAYDESCGRLILFGGVGTDGLLNDTWSFDPASSKWTQLLPGVAPSARAYHSMVYDPTVGRIVLFGGGLTATTQLPHTFYRDTWTFDCQQAVWTRVDDAEPPVADFSFSPGSPTANETVLFDATASSDPNGPSLTFEWIFGDGSMSNGSTVEHAFGAPGSYNVTVRAIDPDGMTALRRVQVNVSSPPSGEEPPAPGMLPGAGAGAMVLALFVAGAKGRRRARGSRRDSP